MWISAAAATSLAIVDTVDVDENRYFYWFLLYSASACKTQTLEHEANQNNDSVGYAFLYFFSDFTTCR